MKQSDDDRVDDACHATNEAENSEAENVDETTTEDPEWLLKEAKRLAAQITDGFLELGRVLSEIRDTDAWEAWGRFGSFEDWVVRQFAFSKSKADQLIAIWRRFGRPGLGFTAKQLNVSEWTKLRAILPIADEKNIDAWLRVARQRTIDDLKRAVRRTRDSGSMFPLDEESEDDRLIMFRAGLHPSQHMNVFCALKSAHEATGPADRPMNVGYLLDLIATESDELWATGSPRHRLDWYIETLERVFEVDIDVRPRTERAADTAAGGISTGGATA